MALIPGTRLGVYEVVAPLGAGGMGEVYRARDTKLDREVALKILPESFAGDHDRLMRFEREAKTLAALNHPHIAQIHGFEQTPAMSALVMELVQGEDLAQRIARGPIPLEEALPIARQIADALEAAHEQGIVHRDLKPANIKVRADGTVKVLDFGLAKALDPHVARDFSPATPVAPTITSPAMTAMGMILGTAAYMAPEQARGKIVDRRADIWAFGCVFYEMLTGRRAFPGDDITDTLAAVVRAEPDWDALSRDLSPLLKAFLQRCLHKDRNQRLGDIHDMRLALDGAFETAASPAPAGAAAPARVSRLAWGTALVLATLVVILSVPTLQHLGEIPPVLPETRLDIVTPPAEDAASFALSPDGRQIVYSAPGKGRTQLWLRSLAATTAEPIAGSEGATAPFWSPDGRSLGFFSDQALKRVDLAGGAPMTLAPVLFAGGGTWNEDGTILYGDLSGELRRVPASGGPSSELSTGVHAVGAGVRWPQFLPDGQHVLFHGRIGNDEQPGLYLGTLDGSPPVRLTDAAAAGAYVPDGWVVWGTDEGRLVARRLDVATGTMTGEAITIADGLLTGRTIARSAVSVARTGMLAYRTGTGDRRQLTWFDRNGTALGTFGAPDVTRIAGPRVSPDGRRVVLWRRTQGNGDIWVLDGVRASRLTVDPATDHWPLWSPDGSKVAFRSMRAGRVALFQKLSGGSGVDEQLVAAHQSAIPTSWSRDSRYLLSYGDDAADGWDMWLWDMHTPGPPAPFLKTRFHERWGTFSPDGRWVAYQSNESGRTEVYLRPFTPPGAAAPGVADARWQVSIDGGLFPAWRRDGRELYYLDPGGAMMAAPIAATGTSLQPGTPIRLFSPRIVGGASDSEANRQYDIAPDGRFLINLQLDDDAAPITVLQNWRPPTP